MRRVTILYNEPVLPADHPDYVSEAGVLESVEAFAAALESGYHVTRLGIGCSLAQVVDRLAAEQPDVVVNLCEGFGGHSSGEPYLTGVLELLGLPYTGSSPECLSLVRDKVRTKQTLAVAGLANADFWLVRREEELGQLPCTPELHKQLAAGNLFVKPAAEDASLGIDERSVVGDWGALAAKVAELQSCYGDVLVERYLDGREFNVGVVALSEPRALPIAEIEFQTDSQFRWPILTYASKWAVDSAGFHATPVRCPALVDDATAVRIREAALAAFAATGCRDYARVDFRVTADNAVYVLEVNANPDAGPAAGLARALAVTGISYGDFASQLVETALKRGSKRTTSAEASLCRPFASQGSNSRSAIASDAGILIRSLKAGETPVLLEVLSDCNMFRADEIEVAEEILSEAIRDATTGHYQVLVAEVGGQPVGWSCHGRVPLTDATYDLYWIAVHPEHQGRRVGSALLKEIERLLKASGARWLLAETSSSPLYKKTCAFYEKAGFEMVGNVPDFYRREDGRITFGKRLDG